MNLKDLMPLQEQGDHSSHVPVHVRPASSTLLSVVPIRGLTSLHRAAIERHLLQLDDRDRYLRFGYAAGDEQIKRYVAGLDFERDDFLGVFNRRLELLAVSHLGLIRPPGRPASAEFGVSVLAKARGRGYGRRLFDRAVVHLRNKGISTMLIHALSENTITLHVARSAGATVERDGSESEAYLQLSPATLDTRLSEIVEEHLARLDYQMKGGARVWQHWGEMVEQWRSGLNQGWHSRRPD